MAKTPSRWEGLDEALGELERELTDVTRGMTVHLFYSILARTPQYYGGMAASWSYNYNGRAYDRSNLIPARAAEARATLWDQVLPDSKAEPAVRRRGDGWAINLAESANAGEDSLFRLGRKTYITNGVDHGEGPYSGEVETWKTTPPLRAANLPGQPVARSLDMVLSLYGNGVKAGQAQRLKAWRIGRG